MSKARQAATFVMELLLVAAVAPDRAVASDQITMPNRGIGAHRGASETHPENTAAALLEAVRLGAHQIEFDIRLSKDGEPVLIHDRSSTRTTNVEEVFPDRQNYNVDAFTFEELRKLDAGSWKGERFRGQRVLSLTDALQIMPHNVWLNVDVKDSDHEIGYVAAKQVHAMGREHQAFLSVRGDAVSGARQYMEASGATVLLNNMNRSSNTPPQVYIAETIEGDFDFIQILREPFPDVDDLERLRDAGIRINYCCTDAPAMLRKWLEHDVAFPLVNDVAPALQLAEQEIGIEPLEPLY